MSFEIEGKLHKKFDTEAKSAKFQARDLVIEVADGQYPQFIKFQLVQERCSLLDEYNEGEQIKVHFDLRGREWNGKYFTNLNAWRLEKVGDSPAVAATPSDDSFPSAADEPNMEVNDDLPF
ncbi:MAG: DUF3127 domain-containing protein [Bacteroidota bacterium]